MNTFKKIGHGLCVLLLPVMLYGLAVSSTAVNVFGSPDKVKRLLTDIAAYDKLTDIFIDNAKQTGDTNNVTLDDEQVDTASRKALTPESVRGIAEQVIDGTYAWLEGKTPTPNFVVDLAPVKRQVADNLGQTAGEKVTGLPACNITQLRQLDPQADVLDLPCRPPGLTAANANQQVINEVMNNPGFLENNTLDPQDFSGGQGNKTVFEQASAAPTIFQFTKKTPWLFGGAAIVLAIGVVFLSATQRKGWRKLGFIFAIIGLMLLISSWIGRFLVNLHPLAKNISVLSNEIFQTLLYFGAAYIALGTVAIIVLRLIRPKAP